MQKNLGGDRLGSGNKMKVDFHGFERSTHDLSYLWRSTMSAGTLVPFMMEVGLPGDTFDINLEAMLMTHPTVGPLFGTYKVQLDIFTADLRLYQGKLHNNKVGIGLDMASVKLPQITLFADPNSGANQDIDNLQINPSCILSHLDIRGVGMNTTGGRVGREFDGTPLLMYWDTVKNYYANKQEDKAYVIHNPVRSIVDTIDTIEIGGAGGDLLPEIPPASPANPGITLNTLRPIVISYTGTKPLIEQLRFWTSNLGWTPIGEYVTVANDTPGVLTLTWTGTSPIELYGWSYQSVQDLVNGVPELTAFNLSDIDTMRENILVAAKDAAAVDINGWGLNPFNLLLDWGAGEISPYLCNQEGLAVKTYQSDLFNNWLNTETIEGANGINEITAISTATGDQFTVETFILKKKVYDMLNRINASGGTWDDYIEATYDVKRIARPETPVYEGGLIKELVFEEVISNSAATNEGTNQPLGTLGGRGVMGHKHKGGNIVIRNMTEPFYIMGIISITPRLDYSQGNKWSTGLKTMDDFHKPSLDQIGFQDLITEQMAWWDTEYDGAQWVTKSAGKQPAWMNYMTNVNKVRGNFAIENNEMFMTLNRRYEYDSSLPVSKIKDLTTYIDPAKYNFVFAQTQRDAQNFWAQVSVNITARRKMSAKIMPNL